MKSVFLVHIKLSVINHFGNGTDIVFVIRYFIKWSIITKLSLYHFYNLLEYHKTNIFFFQL